MNAKNLPLKFTFLALLVAVCVWLPLNRGIRQGIDLRGGHSLIFEIRTNADEVNRLEIRQAELKKKLANATTEQDKKDISETIKRLNNDLEQAIRDSASDSSLAKDMIRIFKERVDPNGLLMIEWIPIGANRFEVRMPAGNPETQKAKNAYRRAIQALESTNIEKSHLRGLEQKRTTVEKLSAGDKKLSALLTNLVTAFEKKQNADEKNIKRLTLDWENAEIAVVDYNIATQKLRSILSGYVRGADLAKVQNQPKAKKALDDRSEGYKNAIKAFLEDHDEVRRLESKLAKLDARIADTKKPEEKKILNQKADRLKEDISQAKKDNPDRATGIENVVKLYKAWADMRQELEDPSDLKRLITKAGALEFRIAPISKAAADSDSSEIEPLPESERNRYVSILRDTLDKEGPQGLGRRTDRYLWFPVQGDRKSGYGSMITYTHNEQKYLLLSNFKGKTLLQRRGADRWALTYAYQTSDERGMPAIGFNMDQTGASLLSTLTGNNQKGHMAILLDNEVYSAPTINAVISSSGIITMGTYDSEDLNSLIKILRAGSLPAKLNEIPVAESSFGPTFGEANRTMGFRAGIIGLIAVAAFMCLYYHGAGIVAVIALMLNIILVLGLMSLINAVLTLPGIAGIILTVGIAVDANVLIFERLREEQQRGTPIRRAIANAYQRAFSAIFDANITTLITCLILGWVGTEEVRGFAITLAFGVMFSMFTALVVTRWIFQILLDMNIISKPMSMLHIIGVPKIKWMAKRHFFWTLSAAMVAIGIGAMITQGSNLLGIEFSAGTRAVITFKDDALIDGKLPTAELVRARVMDKVKQLADEDYEKYGKLAETTRIEARYDYKKLDKFIKKRDTDNDKKITLAEFNAIERANVDFFKLIDANSDKTLDNDELQKLNETSFQLTTTDQSVPKISELATATFGSSLQRRISYKPTATKTAGGYVVVKGETVRELDLEANTEGYAVVQPRRNSAHISMMEDFSNGVVITIRGFSPKMTAREFQERIENTQMQPDFANKTQNRVKVAALATEAGQTTHSDFAIFSRPAAKTPQSIETVASDLSTLLTQSLEREEAIVALNFDAAIASEAAQSAVMAIIMSWIAIVLYVWVRFGSVRWGLAAVVCLIHDVMIVVGLLAATVWMADTALGNTLGIGSFKIDLVMIAAILTVIGYSVNDTIVVFDRIRENRGKLSSVSVMALNSSINQTLGRTLLTSTTTLIVVVIMYVSGGDAIRPFSFALLVGILFGTYSSVAIASPLLMGLRNALVAKTAGMTE
jgi:SecD/SecF fusion protein